MADREASSPRWPRIAITGGIAEGKSTVLGMLAEAGIPVASADVLAREVFRSTKVQRELGSLMGLLPPVLPEQVRERLAADPHFRRRLNQITHPEIALALRSSPAHVIEVPLLLETCLYPEFDRVWVVTCGVEEQRRRLIERLGSSESAEALMATQLPTPVKVAFADRVIWTGASREALAGEVGHLIKFELAKRVASSG